MIHIDSNTTIIIAAVSVVSRSRNFAVGSQLYRNLKLNSRVEATVILRLRYATNMQSLSPYSFANLLFVIISCLKYKEATFRRFVNFRVACRPNSRQPPSHNDDGKSYKALSVFLIKGL